MSPASVISSGARPMLVPEAGSVDLPVPGCACLLVEASPGGLLGGLVMAFIRAEYSSMPVRFVPSTDASMVRVGSDCSSCQMLVLGSHPDPQTIARLVTSGHHSLVTLDSSVDELRTAIQRSLEGGPPFLGSSLVRLLALSSLAAWAKPVDCVLTPREGELVRLLSRGLSNHEMAIEMTVSTNTVRAHLQAISGKLGVTGRTRVIARARDLGLE